MSIRVVLSDEKGSTDLELYSDNSVHKPFRAGEPVQMGKRYTCAHPHKNDYRSGTVDIDDLSVYLGCGAQVLVTKHGDGVGAIYCCDMPMSVINPKPLPSAD